MNECELRQMIARLFAQYDTIILVLNYKQGIQGGF